MQLEKKTHMHLGIRNSHKEKEFSITVQSQSMPGIAGLVNQSGKSQNNKGLNEFHGSHVVESMQFENRCKD